MKSETRISPITSFRIVANTRDIKGTAIVFNKHVLINGIFYETIVPEAVNDLLRQDVRCLFNNDKNFILGRTKAGTLALKKTADALEYYCKLPNTKAGNDLIENIRLGDVSNSIATYWVSGEKWSKLPDGSDLRTITKIKEIHSVGPATFSKVEETVVSLRNKQLNESNFSKRLRQLRLLAIKMRNKKTKTNS